MGQRHDSVESDTNELKKENAKLRTRVSALESYVRRNQVEIIGCPLETKAEPKEIVIQLAKTAGLELRVDHLMSAVRTGPPKTTEGVKCQNITAEFERTVNCSLFLKKMEDLRKTKKIARNWLHKT